MQKWVGGIHLETICRVPVGHLLLFMLVFVLQVEQNLSFVANHLTHTRLAHQASALCLTKLQKEAFISTNGSHSNEAMEIWKQYMVSKSPTFQY